MSNDLTLQQQIQITDLSASVGSLKQLTESAMDKMGDNQRMIKALHQRLDRDKERHAEDLEDLKSTLKEVIVELRVIDAKILTKEEREQELEDILGLKVGRLGIKFIGGLIVAKAPALVAWYNGLFSGVS